MAGQFDTVVAGSKAFALALFAPLTERVGTRPRIAADPTQAAALLPEAGLVVVELQSPGWLAEVTRLVASRPEVRVVAALPKGAEAAAATLSAIGIESVPWTGAAAALLPAIDRALGRGATAVAQPPAATAPAVVTPPVAAPPAARAATIVPPAPPPPGAAPALTPAPPAAVPPVSKPSPSPARPAPATPPAIGAPPPSSGRAGKHDDAEFDVDEELPVASGDPFADPFASQAPPLKGTLDYTASGTWPANVPNLEVAEAALLAGMDGTPPPYPALGAVATQVAGALSAIEEKALARAPLEVDGTPIRRAAAMRVRVGFAFASAPPRGSSSDPDAVATLLGEIDELLSEVNGLAASSSLELAPALGACRNALVKEAIDFSEVAQRYVAAEPAVLAARAPARPRSTTGARAVSSVRAPKAAVDEGTRRPRGALIFLVLLVLAAAGYHGWNLFVGRPAVAGPPVFAGMPANSVGIESADGSIRTLQARPGEKLDPEAVKRFIEMEQAKGRVVVEGAPGYYVSTPAPPAPAK